MPLRRQQADDSAHHGIDLAPMLDFTLNLLIFFIIITSFVKPTGVTVNKPDALTANPVQTGNILIAVEPKDGGIWMNNKKVSLPQVRALVHHHHALRPTDTVVITADKNSHAGMVMKVMQQVRKAGVKTIAVAAQPPGGP